MNRKLTAVWRRMLRRLGPLGLAASVCLVLALVVAAWIPSLMQQRDVLRDRVARLAAEPVAPRQTRVVRQVPLRQQLSDFLASFPPLSQNPEDLRRMFESASHHKVRLPRGEYLFKNEANTPLMTVTVTLPLSADYASTKAFSAEVLEKVPNASLDELRLSRETAGNQVLESQLRFSFVYRKN